MRIGLLTGGGDCPGLNAVIRAIVRKGTGVYGHEFLGFRHGWRGVMERDIVELNLASTRGILPRAGPSCGRAEPTPSTPRAASRRCSTQCATSGWTR